jgi:hypothetical protein
MLPRIEVEHLAVPAPPSPLRGRVRPGQQGLRGLMPARDVEPLGRARGRGSVGRAVAPGVRHRRAVVPVRRPSQRDRRRRRLRHGARGARDPWAPLRPGDLHPCPRPAPGRALVRRPLVARSIADRFGAGAGLHPPRHSYTRLHRQPPAELAPSASPARAPRPIQAGAPETPLVCPGRRIRFSTGFGRWILAIEYQLETHAEHQGMSLVIATEIRRPAKCRHVVMWPSVWASQGQRE